MHDKARLSWGNKSLLRQNPGLDSWQTGQLKKNALEKGGGRLPFNTIYFLPTLKSLFIRRKVLWIRVDLTFAPQGVPLTRPPSNAPRAGGLQSKAYLG